MNTPIAPLLASSASAADPIAKAAVPVNTARLRHFIEQLAQLLDTQPDLGTVLAKGKPLLAELVKHDDWLPDEYAQPHPQFYQQFLLHADALNRFSVVSFVWGPGQQTPVHDHTVWGLIGMLRGSEWSQPFAPDADGHWVPQGEATQLHAGDVEAVYPPNDDVHQVKNAFDDRVSISIHVYGANIGAVNRHVFAPNGEVKPFISGYSNTHLPNIWDLSKG